jgi:antitoxin component of MazEF toxin-antitoxin module
MLTKKINKIANSNYILIPNDFMKILNLKTKDTVSLKLENDKIIITAVNKKEKKCPKCKNKMIKNQLTKMFYDDTICYKTYEYICTNCNNKEEYTEKE